MKMDQDHKLAGAHLAVLLHKLRLRAAGFASFRVVVEVVEGQWTTTYQGACHDGSLINVRGVGWSFAEAFADAGERWPEEQAAEGGKVIDFIRLATRDGEEVPLPAIEELLDENDHGG